jgi:hypothetical protein
MFLAIRDYTNPVCTNHKPCPHPQPPSQAWERGARAAGSGGVRAAEVSDLKKRVCEAYLVLDPKVRVIEIFIVNISKNDIFAWS